MNESVQKTNIPALRKPFGADLPPKVPYCESGDVGSDFNPVYVQGKQIKAASLSKGGPKTPIYMKDGVFTECDPTTNVIVQPMAVMEANPIVAKILVDGKEYAIHGDGGGSGGGSTESLNVPLLTPMWFDYMPIDTRSWIASDGNFHSGTVDAYKRIWNHLSTECAGKENNKTKTFGSITVNYFECSDGHNVCICNNTNAETVRANLNTLVDGDHPEIGTAWFYIINTDKTEFYLPRTRYGFHGDLNYVKFAQAGEHTMRLYFHTGGGPGSDDKQDKVLKALGFEKDAKRGNVAMFSLTGGLGQTDDSGHKIVEPGVTNPDGSDLVTVDYLKNRGYRKASYSSKVLLWGADRFGDNIAAENPSSTTNWFNTPRNTPDVSGDGYNWSCTTSGVPSGYQTALLLSDNWMNYDELLIIVGRGDDINYPIFYRWDVDTLIDLATDLRAAYGTDAISASISKRSINLMRGMQFRGGSQGATAYWYVDLAKAITEPDRFYIPSEDSYVHAFYGLKY